MVSSYNHNHYNIIILCCAIRWENSCLSLSVVTSLATGFMQGILAQFQIAPYAGEGWGRVIRLT